MSGTLIDTHCHITFDDLRQQARDVINRADEAGVSRMINIATNPADVKRALPLMKEFGNVFLAAGVHPHEAAKVTDEELLALADLHRGNWADVPPGRLVAVGETGLDYHYDFATPAEQVRIFRWQLELAIDVGRPVVIHAREAEEQVLDILNEYPALKDRVVFHCYSGGPELTERIITDGYWTSFTGVVTFKNTDAIRESARMMPIERIMVETDAPFMSPAPVRKQRPCEPALVVHTARRIAEERGMSYDEFAAATTANAERFFGLASPAT